MRYESSTSTIMNFSEENGLPPVAAHLFTLAETFASHNHNRSAALAYASASRASGITRYQQAISLYNAAKQLFISIETTKDEQTRNEDYSRSIGYLQKCTIISRDITSTTISFLITMQVLSLIEQIYTYMEDHLDSAKTINSALNIILSINNNKDSKDNNFTMKQFQWWCYFRCKAIINIIVSSNGHSIQQACSLSIESAHICEKNNDILSATAFYLIHTQIALSSSISGFHISPNIDNILTCLDKLKAVPNDRQTDYLLIKFGTHLLQSLASICIGDLRSLRDNLGHLSKSYNRYRQAIKQKQQQQHIDENENSWWNWLPHQYLSAIAYYIMTAVSRSNCDTQSSLIHGMTALSRIGITEQNLSSFTLHDVTLPNICERASLSLTLALLENAARVRLTQVCLNEAALLISAAVDLTFRDDYSRSKIRLAEHEKLSSDDVSLHEVILLNHEQIGIIPRCSAFTLLAEYHNLRGRVSGARIATAFLDAVRAVFNHNHNASLPNASSSTSNYSKSPHNIPKPLDTWQMVVSYLSLLTGDDRSVLADTSSSFNQQNNNDNSGNGGASSRNEVINADDFVSAQVHALAWFSMGVYYMRKTDVLESRRAVSNCLDIVNRSPFGNDQIIANASAILSGLVITRENITQEGLDMAVTAVELARNLGDIVAFVRATRQHKKVLNRVSQSAEERQQIEQIASDAMTRFTEQTKHVGQIFSES